MIIGSQKEWWKKQDFTQLVFTFASYRITVYSMRAYRRKADDGAVTRRSANDGAVTRTWMKTTRKKSEVVDVIKTGGS